MTYKEVYALAMPEAKRKKERLNIWVAAVIRPLSVILTIPLIKTQIKPVTITKISIFASVAGFFLLALNVSLISCLIGWFCFFIWAVLDGVDGNLARCTNQCSEIGTLWDAFGGYTTLIMMYFGAGIAAYNDTNIYDFTEPGNYLILGGATALMAILPRLIFHKKQQTSGTESTAVKTIAETYRFSIVNLIRMNLLAYSGAFQLVLLVAILTHTLNFFIAGYFVINLLIMLISLRTLLKK